MKVSIHFLGHELALELLRTIKWNIANYRIVYVILVCEVNWYSSLLRLLNVIENVIEVARLFLILWNSSHKPLILLIHSLSLILTVLTCASLRIAVSWPIIFGSQRSLRILLLWFRWFYSTLWKVVIYFYCGWSNEIVQILLYILIIDVLT